MTRHRIRATLQLLRSEEGGRSGPIQSGYRSLVRFEGAEVEFGFELELDEPPLAPGAEGGGLLSLWAVDELPILVSGSRFEVREGTRVVGRGTIDTS
jgi:translation elongation factor EF-Tu-like GTPase